MKSMSITKKLCASLLAVVLLLSGVIIFQLAGLGNANRNLKELENKSKNLNEYFAAVDAWRTVGGEIIYSVSAGERARAGRSYR